MVQVKGSADATRQWRPNPGQIALVEPADAEPGQECLTGVVVPGDRVTIDLGASPRPPAGISEVTVKGHRGHVMQKLRANSLAELVRMAGRVGIEPEATNLHDIHDSHDTKVS